MEIQLQNQASVCSIWEVGTLTVQIGTQQARVDWKRDLGRISKLLLWVALSSFLLLMHSTARCQGCNDLSGLPRVRRRELACASRSHQNKLLEAWLGNIFIFFFFKGWKNTTLSKSVKFYFWWGKNQYEWKVLFCVLKEGFGNSMPFLSSYLRHVYLKIFCFFFFFIFLNMAKEFVGRRRQYFKFPTFF